MSRLPKHPKVRGELAEAQFVPVAIHRGFRVAKPFGDSAPYDFLVEKNGVTTRVQVKATGRRIAHGWFQLATRRGVRKRYYSAREIDFVVAYLFLEDIWYVIPVREVTGRTIFVRPGSGGKYEKFREAWKLLAWGRRRVPRLARRKLRRAPSG
jgi:hypothetical protein